MMRLAFLLALVLGLGGLSAGAETVPAEGEEGEAVDHSYREVTVTVDEVIYTAAFYLSGKEPTMVNGQEMVTEDDLPLTVDIFRADGSSMADQLYLARDVLDQACQMRGFRGDPAVTPMLSAAGVWTFSAGCLW